MIVIYTFDYDGNKILLDMLKLSILSVIREFHSFKDVYIHLYTTTYDILKDELKPYLDYISLVYYDPHKFDQPTDLHFAKPIYDIIGHARMYIMKHILHTSNESILYMDEDTGVNIGMGERLIKYIKQSDIPIMCNYEYNTANEICTVSPNPTFFKVDEFEVDNVVYKFWDGNINNGIEFYPNNQLSRDISIERLKVYNKLNTLNLTYFNDMFSIALIMKERGFESSCFTGVYKSLETTYMFTHYYRMKIESISNVGLIIQNILPCLEYAILKYGYIDVNNAPLYIKEIYNHNIDPYITFRYGDYYPLTLNQIFNIFAKTKLAKWMYTINMSRHIKRKSLHF